MKVDRKWVLKSVPEKSTKKTKTNKETIALRTKLTALISAKLLLSVIIFLYFLSIL
ncbi:hypothetical protein [Cloacibacterium sp.]|uniref:hypothetical protein n=1 Tax=Cloacibacterium sp. TaxID=1913682 RepID=UPI0039E6C988